MKTVEYFLLALFVVFGLGFCGSVHWWLRKFPDVPVMKVFNYSPPIRNPYFNQSDFGVGQYLAVSAVSARWPA